MTIITIPDSQVKILDSLSKKKDISRAEVIRQAIANYLSDYTKVKKSYKSAFGIWKEQNIDSLSYQKKLRDEWDG